MSAAVGFVTAAAQYGLESILIKPKRSIGPIEAQVTLEEQHHDDLEITDHPVEQGAAITDHAFKRPAELVLRVGWSNSPSVPGLIAGLVNAVTGTIDGVQSLLSGSSASQVREIYDKLLKLQESRIPFDVYTGKRLYKNMLFKSLATSSDNKTENALMVTAVLRQVLIVTTQTVTVTTDSANQANPKSTSPTVNAGNKQLQPAPNYNPQAGP